jgi:hypothetical protein
MAKPTQKDILDTALKAYRMEELTQMSRQSLNGLLTIVRNQLVANRQLSNTDMTRLRSRFEKVHSNPALGRLRSPLQNSQTTPSAT